MSERIEWDFFLKENDLHFSREKMTEEQAEEYAEEFGCYKEKAHNEKVIEK